MLSSGYLPADLQPTALLGAALARQRGGRAPGTASRSKGMPGSVRYFAAEAGATAGGRADHAGGQAALAACFRGLAAPGAPIVVESPTYLGALVAARAQGLRPVPVPADAHGIRPDLLADALATSARGSSTSSPCSRTRTARRCRRSVAPGCSRRCARRARSSSRTTRSGTSRSRRPAPPPLFADDPDGHVVHIRSLTKASAPGPADRGGRRARTGAARLRAARIVEDLFVTGPLQEAALEVVGAPAWRAHLRRLRKVLRERRDALAAALPGPVGCRRAA